MNRLKNLALSELITRGIITEDNPKCIVNAKLIITCQNEKVITNMLVYYAGRGGDVEMITFSLNPQAELNWYEDQNGLQINLLFE